MGKTLVVSYLPAADGSVTKKILDHFLAQAGSKTTVIHRNLLKTLPPVFDETSMAAYKARGFAGQPLAGAQAEAMKPFDVLIEEIQSVDQVVFAFPLHNWSEPGVVKSYIDAVSQYGKLIQFGAKGPEGTLKDHKAAVFFASGGVYEEGNPRRTIQPAFTFWLNAIGIKDLTFVTAGGTLMGPEASEKHLTAAKNEVDSLVKAWY